MHLAAIHDQRLPVDPLGVTVDQEESCPRNVVGLAWTTERDCIDIRRA
jgi:hypothetical protein